MLREAGVTASSQWRKISEGLETDPRCQAVDRVDRIDLFQVGGVGRSEAACMHVVASVLLLMSTHVAAITSESCVGR